MKQLCIQRIVNFPIDSNCYLITAKDLAECILVDPALENPFAFYQNLNASGLRIKYIILTHEHFDHIRSVEWLRKESGCKVISTLTCSKSITDPKKNLSLFYDQVGFSCAPSDIIITINDFMLRWATYNLEFYLTPGHTDGSLSFSIGNHLFTGDTIIPSRATIVKLPGGNVQKLKKSIGFLMETFNVHTIVYPGHGEIFPLSEITIDFITGKK